MLATLLLMGCEDDGVPVEDAGPPPDPTVLEVEFDPNGSSFWSTPWPSDARLTAEGTPDMSGFPARRRQLDVTLTEIEGHVHGFANNVVAYFVLSADITDATLREGPASLEPDSPIQLVDLSEEGCGERVPIEVAFATERDPIRPARTLQVASAIGTLLRPGRPYGVLLLRSLASEDGRETLRPDAFDEALSDESEQTALSRSLGPLRRCAPVALDDVAVATVFTPQDPVAETRRLRDFVADPARAPTRAVDQWRRSDGWSRFRLNLRTYVGTVPMPIFQDGETPYDTDGGRLILDDAGEPVIQRWEDVPIAIAMRELDPEPTEPRPVLVFTDGTGWSRWNHLRDNLIIEALDDGYVVAAFMPQFHGERAGFEGSSEISTFNLPNPPAARNNFRQQAAETSFFLRVLREQIDGQPGMPAIDLDRVVYGGHSQGALVGALVAAVEHGFAGFVLNGLSSNLTQTILFREDLLDFELVVRTIYNFGPELDRFHPLLQIIQMGAEVVDPHNYAARWRGDEGLPGGNHVFVSNGYEDDTTTPRGMEHLTIAADMSPIDPPGWDVDSAMIWDGAPVSLPVSGNESAFDGSPLTIATYLDFDQGHFTIYRRPFVRELAATFWRTAREGVPELSSEREYQCGDGADEDRDGMLDCADPDCADRPPCVEGPCDNGIDDDGNGQTDCADPVCASDDACTEQECGDGVDDDGDGAVDCADEDCDGEYPCAETECGDGADDDGDGLVDCDDDECEDSRDCREWSCRDDRDNEGDGLTDCEDDECLMSLACPEATCGNGADDNGDGFSDCLDVGCALDPICAVAHEADCTDGTDDDADGAIDCEDADCGFVAACRAGTCAAADLGSQTGFALWTGMLAGRDNALPPGDCASLGRGDETPDVSFAWTAPAAGDYIFSTYGSEVDTILHLLGPDCDPAGELDCDDDRPASDSSLFTYGLEAGQTVVIVINAASADEPEDVEGVVTLHVYPAP